METAGPTAKKQSKNVKKSRLHLSQLTSNHSHSQSVFSSCPFHFCKFNSSTPSNYLLPFCLSSFSELIPTTPILDFLFGNSVIMTAREILHKMKVKAGFSSAPADTGKGKGKMLKHITHGFHLVKGKANHPMEDFLVSQFKQVEDKELGLFAIFDGHMGHDVANYLQSHLFQNILKQPDFWTEPETAIRNAYDKTDTDILEKVRVLGKGGSTAVTAILLDGQTLMVANVGDSRAVICNNGEATQLSVDHDPGKEKTEIENRGGFVSNIPGDVPRVDGQLAVARAFGDKSLKIHLSSEPHVQKVKIDDTTEFLILASDGLWKVMTNQEAVDAIKNIKDAQSAAKHLTEAAVSRKSKDDISCIVVRFQ